MAERVPGQNRRRRWSLFFKVTIILAISAIIVVLFPKTASFNYTYQKGMAWKHDNLTAPFDFPIYKSGEEIKGEEEKAIREQPPIYNVNDATALSQVSRFSAKLNEFKTADNEYELHAIAEKLASIYKVGLIPFSEEYAEGGFRSVIIIRDGVSSEDDYHRFYTPKKAYSDLSGFIGMLQLSDGLGERILALNLDEYLKPNLDYDQQKTRAATVDAIRNINQTQGMVREGDLIISKGELVTPEKFKIIESYRLEHDQILGSPTDRAITIISQSILVLIAIIIFSLFLYVTRKRLFYNNKDFFFLYCMFLLTVLLGSMTRFLNIPIMAIPVLFFPIIVNVLFGNKAALYLLVGTTLLIAWFAPDSYLYLFMQLAGGIVAIYSLKQLQRRGQLFVAIALIFLTYALVYGAFTLIQQGHFAARNLLSVLSLVINALLLTLTYPVLYLVERLFGYTSEITLLEYSNPNHPVLRNLSRKAPGTFQHSMMVANLAEEAIYHIGGSPLLARTGAMYHDIGKMFDPVMFIENQSGGINPHDSLDFDESARVIIGHVTKGIEIANKNKLPEVIVNFIRTHHGRSKVKYFYHSFKNKYPDRPIDESAFTYPGPDPNTRESAVLMMADAVEAASRSLKIKNEENLRNLVDIIINDQLSDGRFANADITFRDISTVKRVFTEMLINIYHARISYPKLNETPASLE